MLLDALLAVGDYQRGAPPLYKQIAQDLASNRWYSTQSTAYGLMAVSKYIAALSEHAPAITGEVGIDGQMRAVQEEGGAAAVLSLSPLEGQVVTFKNTTAAPLFAP